MDVSTLESIGSLVVAALVGGLVRHYINLPDKFRDKDDKLTERLTMVEQRLAVMDETKTSEAQVRAIMHEQLKPVIDRQETLQADMMTVKQTLVRIETLLTGARLD